MCPCSPAAIGVTRSARRVAVAHAPTPIRVHGAAAGGVAVAHAIGDAVGSALVRSARGVAVAHATTPIRVHGAAAAAAAGGVAVAHAIADAVPRAFSHAVGSAVGRPTRTSDMPRRHCGAAQLAKRPFPAIHRESGEWCQVVHSRAGTEALSTPPRLAFRGKSHLRRIASCPTATLGSCTAVATLLTHDAPLPLPLPPPPAPTIMTHSH
jgi:hypothetical protein